MSAQIIRFRKIHPRKAAYATYRAKDARLRQTMRAAGYTRNEISQACKQLLREFRQRGA